MYTKDCNIHMCSCVGVSGYHNHVYQTWTMATETNGWLLMFEMDCSFPTIGPLDIFGPRNIRHTTVVRSLDAAKDRSTPTPRDAAGHGLPWTVGKSGNIWSAEDLPPSTGISPE